LTNILYILTVLHNPLSCEDDFDSPPSNKSFSFIPAESFIIFKSYCSSRVGKTSISKLLIKAEVIIHDSKIALRAAMFHCNPAARGDKYSGKAKKFNL